MPARSRMPLTRSSGRRPRPSRNRSGTRRMFTSTDLSIAASGVSTSGPNCGFVAALFTSPSRIGRSAALGAAMGLAWHEPEPGGPKPCKACKRGRLLGGSDSAGSGSRADGTRWVRRCPMTSGQIERIVGRGTRRGHRAGRSGGRRDQGPARISKRKSPEWLATRDTSVLAASTSSSAKRLAR